MSTELTVLDGKLADQTTTLATRVEPRHPVRLLQPIASPDDIIVSQNATRKLLQKALQQGRDFGTFGGVKKPSLLKPGAERVVLAFGCYARFTVVESEIDHDREVRWTKRKQAYRNEYRGDRRYDMVEEQGVSLGLYRYVVRCDIVSRETETVVGNCAGACSTLESKYIDRPRDVENTVLKMAVKRALVGAVLLTFGLSDQFTQDLDDQAFDEHESAPTGAAPKSSSPAPAVSAPAVAQRAPGPALAAPPKRAKQGTTPEETISFIRDASQTLARRLKAVGYLFGQAGDAETLNAYYAAIMQYADSADAKSAGGPEIGVEATEAFHARWEELHPTEADEGVLDVTAVEA